MKPYRALLVERQPVVARFLRDALRRSGCAVVTTRTASDAALRRSLPDTVVIGPGIDGRALDAIRRVRLTRSSANIVVIAYREDPAWRAMARAIGADTVLGPGDDGSALSRAIGETQRQEKRPMRRTS